MSKFVGLRVRNVTSGPEIRQGIQEFIRLFTEIGKTLKNQDLDAEDQIEAIKTIFASSQIKKEFLLEFKKIPQPGKHAGGKD